MYRKIFLISAAILFTLLVLFCNTSHAQAACCGNTVTVQRGDTLSKIAARCGVTVNQILRANPSITNPNLIHPGQVIIMPGATLPHDPTTDYYYVRPGDL